MTGAGRVVVSQTVNDAHRRAPPHEGFHIDCRGFTNYPERDHLQLLDQSLSSRCETRLDGADHDVLASLAATAGFVEHPVGLAHARRVSQEDLQVPLAGRG